MALSESPTVNKLASRLIELLRSDQPALPQDTLSFTVGKLVSDYAAELSESTITGFVDEIKNNDVATPKRMIP